MRDKETIEINIPLFLLPPESREGNILNIITSRHVKETETAKERIFSLLERLKNKDIGWTEFSR